jgi:hypothetical protein
MARHVGIFAVLSLTPIFRYGMGVRTFSVMQTDEPTPEIPRAGVDLTALPDEGWIYDQNQALNNWANRKPQRASLLNSTTVCGAKTGRLRRIPLMRVTHNGCHAAVASKGGPANPLAWYYNLKAHPDAQLQDMTTIG